MDVKVETIKGLENRKSQTPQTGEPADSNTAATSVNAKGDEKLQQAANNRVDDDRADNKDELKLGPVALSFDQVNSNTDELVELRGGGRYFGVIDPESGETVNQKQSMGPLCANCHRRGHIRAKCKTVICHKCGVVGDHYETQCPTTMICAKCGGKGHKAIDCTNKTKKRQYCKTCDLFNHNDDNCPNIWRSYLLINSTKDKKRKEPENLELPIIYCYNCGDEGHYGDDCKQPRTSRIPNIAGSAFSGNNLPSNLRKLYYKKIHDNSLPQRPSFKSYNNNYNNKFNYGGPQQQFNQFDRFNNNGFRKDQPSRSGYLKPRSSGVIYKNNNPNSSSNGTYKSNNNKNSYSNNSYNNTSNTGPSGYSGTTDNSRKKRKQAPTRSGFLDNRKKSNFRNLY